MSDKITFVERAQGDQSVDEMLRDHRTQGVTSWKPKWDKATRLQKFVGGDHWDNEADRNRVDRGDRGHGRSPHLTIREIDPILATFSGRQMMQRFERAYMPRHLSATRQGEVMTAIDHAFMHATDAEQVESLAFKDGPGIQGVSVIRWELDDLRERGGGLILSEVPIWQIIADPLARGINLFDRSWHRFGDWWAASTVRERWPKKWQDILNSMGASSWSPKDATESSRIPWVGMSGNKPLESFYPRGRSFWVEREEWKEIKFCWSVGVPADSSMSYEAAFAALAAPEEPPTPQMGPDGQPAMTPAPPRPDPFSQIKISTLGELEERKKSHSAQFNGEEIPDKMIVQYREVVYKYAYIIGDVTVETGDIPTNYWTFQFLTGTRMALPNKVEWMSLVERLVDVQKWIDVFFSAQIRNIQITPKGLLFVEEGFFKNRAEAMSSWANPGGLIMVKRGALTSGQGKGYDFVSGGTQPYAAMIGELMAFAREALPRIAGFNPGALGQVGSDLRRISGEVLRQVQDSAMTANAEAFDSLRHARREGGRIFLSFLRKFFTVEDIIRIVGEENAYDVETDTATGEPVMDPATGQPKRVPVVPGPETWQPDYWKEITVEDVVPTADQLQSVWKAIETSIQIMLQPQPDTGQPVFSSEDIAEMVPGIPAQRRQKMLMRIKAAQRAKMMQAQPPAAPGPGGGAPADPNAPPANGGGAEAQAG